MSLIDTDVDLAVIPTWTQVADMTNVIHTEEVDVLSVAGGHLQIEPFCVPNLDCRIIGALIYHCCGTGRLILLAQSAYATPFKTAATL